MPPTSPCARLIQTAALLALFGCGGGGGSGPATTSPLLVGVALIGTSPIPTPGDTLQLTFSEDVVLVAGKLLDEADLLVNGGSLGTITNAPTQLTGRTIAITLGGDGSLVPGTTSVDIKPGNDAVQSVAGRLAIPGTARVLTAGDGVAPVIQSMTLSAVTSNLNGEGPAGGVLQVGRNGFTIHIRHSDANGQVDLTRTVLTSDRAVVVGGATQPAGTNLALLQNSSLSQDESIFEISSNTLFPEGTQALTVVVFDQSGMASDPRSFTFRVRTATAALRPFETTQVWFLDLSRDVESYTFDPGSAFQPVTVVPGANGRSDLEDLFFFLGLHGTSSAVNTAVMTRFRNELEAELLGLFPGVDIQFTFQAPGSFPSGATSVPYANFGFSQIAIAGAESSTGTSGILGVALFDPNNKTQNDNTRIDFGGSQRLGVFMHTLVNAGCRPPNTSLFRQTFDPFRPSAIGTPIGDVFDDDRRVAGTLNDGRAMTITTAIRRLARVTAVITAHECGHSMGLVKNGAMPAGLYGGDSTNFPGSADGHIDVASTFPSGSQNVMSPAVSFDTAVASGTAFNSLNLAYLRERVIHDD